MTKGIEVVGYRYSEWDSQERIFLLERTPEAIALADSSGVIDGVEEVNEAIKEYVAQIIQTDEGMFDLMASMNISTGDDYGSLDFDEKKTQYMDKLVAEIKELDGEWGAELQD